MDEVVTATRRYERWVDRNAPIVAAARTDKHALMASDVSATATELNPLRSKAGRRWLSTATAGMVEATTKDFTAWRRHHGGR